MRGAILATLTLGALLLAGACAGDDGAACDGVCTGAATSAAGGSSGATSSSSRAGVDAAADLGLGDPGECVVYPGCASDVRYCLYGAEFGHQVPDYYSAAVMAWFRSF